MLHVDSSALLFYRQCSSFFVFFFNDTATTEIYTLSLHDALPISNARACSRLRRRFCLRCCDTDRKSTRLNSSHGYISYAVFCLKKKKRQSHNAGRSATRPHTTAAPLSGPPG